MSRSRFGFLSVFMIPVLVVVAFGTTALFESAQAQDAGIVTGDGASPPSQQTSSGFPSFVSEREAAVADSDRVRHPPIRVERIRQDAVILVDETTGRSMIALPNSWTPELVDMIVRYMLRDQQSIEPTYTIQDVEAEGRVENGKAQINFLFRVITRDDAVVRVPLGLKEGIVVLPENMSETATQTATQADLSPDSRNPIRDYQGDGRVELVVDPQDGYVLLFRHPEAPQETAVGEEDTESRSPDSKRRRRDLRHELRLIFWFPLAAIDDGGAKLTVSFPIAVRSQLLLAVPEADANPIVPQGVLPPGVRPSENGGTEFLLRGLKSPLEIAWQKKKAPLQVEEKRVLSVEGARIDARITEDRIDYDVALPIRCRGTIDSFLLKMPPGVQLIHDSIADPLVRPYTVGILASSGKTSPNKDAEDETTGGKSPEDKNTDDRDTVPAATVPAVTVPAVTVPAATVPETAEPTVLEVRLLEKLGMLTFTFRATKPLTPNTLGDVTEELFGFEVLEAEKQSGVLTVELPRADQRLITHPVRGIARSEPVDVTLQKPNLARFEFFTQPFLLNVRVMEPRTRINVRPEYVVAVEKDLVRLSARLAYTIHGSRAESLRIRLPGWSTPEIAPFHLVDVARMQWDGDTLIIPLQEPQEGTMELHLETTRPMPRLSTVEKIPLRIEMPSPEADSVALAPVAIAPADCIQLFPREPQTEDKIPGAGHPAADHPVGENASEDGGSEENPVPDDSVAAGTATPGERIVGLSRSVRRSAQPFRGEIPQYQQAPLIYRAENEGACFVADVLYHRQEVSMSSASEVHLRETDNQVRQTLTYTILHERLDNLYLYMPKAVDEAGRWRILLDDKDDVTPEVRTVPMGPEEHFGELYVKKRIPLERIGTCELTVVFPIDPVGIARDFSVPLSIPFILPVEIFSPPTQPDKAESSDGAGGDNVAGTPENAETAQEPEIPENAGYEENIDHGGHFEDAGPFTSREVFGTGSISARRPPGNISVTLYLRKGIDVSLNEKPGSDWRFERSRNDIYDGRQVQRFRSSHWEDSIDFLVSQEGRDALGTTVVDRAWIQTRLGEDSRVDHFAFQFTSDQDVLGVSIPGEVLKGQVVALLDGQRVEAQLLNPGELLVPLSAAPEDSSRTLEIWYQLRLERHSARLALELPHFDPDVMVRCMYWQLILPRHEHLVGIPDGWTAEYQWGWTGLIRGRYPALSQEDIGLRVGSVQDNPVPEQTNRYLLSTLQQQPETELYLMRRGTVVLVGSGLTLLIGLILIYVPASRYAGSLFCLTVVLLATVLYRPAPILLFLQASILGVLLALGAFYLDRLFRRSDRWTPGSARGSSVGPSYMDDSVPPQGYSVIVDDSAEEPGLVEDSALENPGGNHD